MHMNHGILGIRRRNQPVYPREKIGLGTEEKKVKEIPKEMKYFGYRESKKVRNTQQEK